MAATGTLVGVFESYHHGREALDVLQREGFALGQLGLVSKDEAFVDQIALLAEADVASRGLFQVLVDMGVPRAEADHYAHMLDLGSRTIVTVAAPAAPGARQAARVLRRCGVRELYC